MFSINLIFFKSKDVASVCQCLSTKVTQCLHSSHSLSIGPFSTFPLVLVSSSFFLSFSCLLYLKIIGDPEAQVAEDEEGDNLSARLLVVVLLVNLLLLQVGDEEQLEVHLAINQLNKYTKNPKKASSASSLDQH